MMDFHEISNLFPLMDDLAYVMRMQDIRDHLEEWAKQYPEQKIQNRGYFTCGLLISQWWFEKLAIKVLII